RPSDANTWAYSNGLEVINVNQANVAIRTFMIPKQSQVYWALSGDLNAINDAHKLKVTTQNNMEPWCPPQAAAILNATGS
ncbi:hypothetical protein OFN55_41265, partial [Escherichia coli]|nr:hypothetical protein [Escherichia coli]